MRPFHFPHFSQTGSCEGGGGLTTSTKKTILSRKRKRDVDKLLVERAAMCSSSCISRQVVSKEKIEEGDRREKRASRVNVMVPGQMVFGPGL